MRGLNVICVLVSRQNEWQCNVINLLNLTHTYTIYIIYVETTICTSLSLTEVQ